MLFGSPQNLVLQNIENSLPVLPIPLADMTIYRGPQYPGTNGNWYLETMSLRMEWSKIRNKIS